MRISRRQSWRPWKIKDPSAERTRLENLHVRQPLGVQQANRARSARRASIYAANWQFVHTKWPRKVFTFVAEINLTLRPRSLDFTVGPRGEMTLRPRTTALTVGDR